MGKMSSPSSPHTPGSRRSRASSGLSLDLSVIPPLITPAPPSNTLLITNLDHPLIFTPQNLDTIRSTIATHSSNSLHAFSPLKSLRRIIATFADIPSAQAAKSQLDGIDMMGCRVRVYFGVNTDVSPTRTHLAAPAAAKLFFISPPPSPPHGWEMRNEEPPNTEVHAEDLATALARLNAKATPMPVSPVEDVEIKVLQRSNSGNVGRRSRSATLVYHPEHHGSSPLLPAISVEDTTEDDWVESPVDEVSPMEGVVKTAPILAHTARPPVELMGQ